MKKKKILLISGLAIIIVVVALLILLPNKDEYKIKVSLVDEHSPARILTVYNSKNEKIDVMRIEYLDGTILCNGYNTTAYYGDIENEKELKVILKDKSEAVAKIIKEEVK